MSARTSVWVTALSPVFPAVASAQQSSAVDITREDVHTVLASRGRSIDRQLKVVDIDVGNVAVGILHRTGTTIPMGSSVGSSMPRLPRSITSCRAAARF
jgi:hypothetical protein